MTLVAVGVSLAVGCDAPSDGVVSGDGPLFIPASAVNVLGHSESIALVQDLEALPDGSVWVLNSVEPFFIGFDSDGNALREHGAAGGGPDEFLLPSAFVDGSPGAKAWVFDLRRHAFVNVSEEGERTQLSIPADRIAPGSVIGGRSMLTTSVRTARLGDEIVMPRTPGTREAGIVQFRMSTLHADLLAWNPTSGAVREIVALSEALGDPAAAGFDPVVGGFPLWYRLWAVCGEDEIRVYDRTANTIRAFGANGTERASTPLPPVQLTAATPRQFASAVFTLRAAEVTGGVGVMPNPADSARLMNQMLEDADGSPSELAAYLPRYVDFHCADDGTQWIQRVDLERGGMKGGAWLRLASDGTAREVHMPEGFDAFRFTGGRVWGVQRDEFDVASVAWIDAAGSASR